MGKKDASQRSVINGEFRTQPRQERVPIGFNRERELPAVKMNESTATSDQCQITCGIRSDVDNTIISVVRAYMEERSKRCYREGIDRDLMVKLDKIFIKFYEEIA